LTKNPIGVNLMVAMSNYDELINVTVKMKADVIISGAGLPLRLPELIGKSEIKLVPLVSSGRAFRIIYERWKKRYNRIPDAVIVEGPLAGGHLGFSMQELKNMKLFSIETLLKDVINEVQKTGSKIPVIAAGGIFNGKDIAHMLKMGARGVQIATRFICTNECDVPDAVKQAVLDAKKEDMVVINSPVGMPGRVIKNPFVELIMKDEQIPFNCDYKCLKTCDYKNVQYCVAEALVNGSRGNFHHGFLMAGMNAYKVKNIVSVNDLIQELTDEAVIHLQEPVLK
ncbi:MAG: nitronate monooxygenase, partial [Elusimicrobia bacterium]|nr:nitronate monooxygenase [Elusimicrobiota bacterium]